MDWQSLTLLSSSLLQIFFKPHPHLDRSKRLLQRTRFNSCGAQVCQRGGILRDHRASPVTVGIYKTMTDVYNCTTDPCPVIGCGCNHNQKTGFRRSVVGRLGSKNSTSAGLPIGRVCHSFSFSENVPLFSMLTPQDTHTHTHTNTQTQTHTHTHSRRPE